MSDTPQADGGATATEEERPITEADMLDRGVGVKVENLTPEKDGEAIKAVDEFKELQGRFQANEEEGKVLKEQRNQAIRGLKDQFNISFSSIAEIIGNTSSLVLYLYQRAQGMSAKEIREASERSAAAKAMYRETDPNRKPVRKQSPEEKDLRKRQREELKAFLEAQRAAGGDDAPSDEEVDELDE